MTMKRLPKAQRRGQLLETAAAIVRAEGTDALTLARVAEQAGVTKPVAYEHFGTRTGLLMALYHHFDSLQAAAVADAMSRRGHSLCQVAEILAEAYVDCTLSAGPEFAAISDALSASEEMDGFRQVLRRGYVDQFATALSPFLTMAPAQARLLLVGVIAAADALAQATAAGTCTRDDAVAAVLTLMTCSLG